MARGPLARRRRGGSLALKQLIQACGGGRWKKPGYPLLGPQYNGRIDEVLNQTRPVDLHTLPSAAAYSRPRRSLHLRQTLANPANANSPAQFLLQFCRSFQHGSLLSHYTDNVKIMVHA